MSTQLRSQRGDGGYRENCRVLYRERGHHGHMNIRKDNWVAKKYFWPCQRQYFEFVRIPTQRERKEQANETAYCL
jgi:hypothetical protein